MSDATRTDDAVVIERYFDAPADLVWQMWTDPIEFSSWYGPHGASVDVVSWDLQVGGTRLIRMSASTPRGDMTMWFAGEFVDLVANTRLVYTEYPSNENGEPAYEPPTATANAHAATEVRVILTELDGRTKMVMTHRGIPADSPGAAGWTIAFDKLAAHVRDRLA